MAVGVLCSPSRSFFKRNTIGMGLSALRGVGSPSRRPSQQIIGEKSGLTLRPLHQEILIRFQACRDGGARAWRHHLFWIISPQDLKKLDTTGTQMGAPAME